MHVLKAASSLDTYRWLCPAASKQLPVEFSGAEMLVQVIRNVLWHLKQRESHCSGFWGNFRS